MKKILIILVIIIALLSLTFYFINQANNEEKETSEESFSWVANYIWAEESEPNMWACFRKDFFVSSKKDIENVKFRIAVDSKYFMYINGELVVRDGALKKQVRDCIYYDEIDVSDYLKKGENNISILVWYYGVSSFSHVDTGTGALLFQGKVGNQDILSDETWKVIINPAYIKDEELINKRLAEKNIIYDARKELVNWYKPEYDDSNWENAKMVGTVYEERYGDLIPRDIPDFIYSDDIIPFENSKEYENKSFDDDVTLALELPYNKQLFPYFEIESDEEGKVILVSNIHDFNNELFYGKITYFTKEGKQEFESPSWINGDRIFFYIPKGVKVLKLGYRDTHYDTKMEGSFKSDDEALNKLWDMADVTLLVNMRDTYMDCPDRERALWIADASLEMEEAMYALDPNANALYEKSINTFVSWQDSYAFLTVVPPFCANLQLPVQNLIGIQSLYKYYLYTGNKEILENAYPHFKKYMELWEIGDDGLTRGTGEFYYNNMEWFDSQGTVDRRLSGNAWYYYTLTYMSKIANVLDEQEDESYYNEKIDIVKNGIEKKYYDGTAYRAKGFKGYDARANSVLVLSRISSRR